MNPVESLLVDGMPGMRQSFVVPDMSLSSGRQTRVPHSFAVRIDVGLITALLEPRYAALVQDLRADDATGGGPQDVLADAGYPPLRKVFERPELTWVVLGEYLLRDCFGPFTWDGVAPIQYWLDHVTHCQVEPGHITMFGICYS